MYNGEYGVSTDENGLYYMRARYYNPEIKRFINQDVVIGSIADSPSLNRYAYVEGNPISLADPFGLSPGVDWRGAAHFLLGALSLLTLIPTPVTYIIGAAASIANAALYAEEGNYFAAICNAIPVFGGGFGLVGKLEKPACWLMKTLQYSTAGLSIGTGAYDIYQIGKENYQKYVVDGEDFSLSDMFSDLFRGALDVVSIAGGAKLATEPTSWCFVGETLIAYENGQKRIDEIEVGDKVWAYDIETGITELKEVQIVYVHDCDEILHLHTSCGDIDTTSNHPFYVIGKGWVTAGELEAGDEVHRLDGSTAIVMGSELERLAEPVKVYNLEVEDYHTYFVGDVPVLVHNYEQKDIDNAVRKVPKKYKELNRCEEFADSLTEKLEKARIPFKKIKVTSNEGKIYSEKYRDVIGIDYHYGIEVDGKVYDNLTLDGMEFSEWLKDMGFGAFKIKTPSGEIVDLVSWEYV